MFDLVRMDEEVYTAWWGDGEIGYIRKDISGKYMVDFYPDCDLAEQFETQMEALSGLRARASNWLDLHNLYIKEDCK